MRYIDEAEHEMEVLPFGYIRRIYQEEKKTLSWLSINQIYGLRRRRVEKQSADDGGIIVLAAAEAKDEDKDSSADEDVQTAGILIPPAIPINDIGRKKGSTYLAKEEAKCKKQQLLEDISSIWKAIGEDKKGNTQLFELIAIRKTFYDMEDEDVKEPTIISRVCRIKQYL
jgi:hypothetical protein